MKAKAASIGTALTVATAGLTLATPATATADTCADTIVVVGVDGTGAVGAYPTLVTEHSDKWAAEGAETKRIDYPGSIWPIGPYTYDQSRRDGIDATKAEIRATRERCPGSHVHLEGHSQGSAVIGDALEELTAEGFDTSNISADLYADPRHPGTGIEVVLPGIIPGYTMKGERGSTGNAQVYQQCVQGDPVCDFPEPFQDPIGLVDSYQGYMRKHGYHLPDSPEPRDGVHVIPAGPMTPGLPPEEQRTIPGPKLQDVIDYEVSPLPDLPPLPNATEPYVERPLSTYIPDEVEPFLPPQINDYIPPPAPTLPPLPPLPAIPGL